MTYLNGDERKAVILDTAVQVIYAKGIRAITAREVSKQAGMSIGLLHHYFESIYDLRAQAILKIFENEIEFDKKKNVQQRAAKALLSMVLGNNIQTQGNCYNSNQLWDEALFIATGDTYMQAACTQGLKKWHEEVVHIIERGRESTEFRPGIPAKDLAWQFIGLCCGLEGIVRFKGLSLDANKIKEHIELLMRTVLLS